MPVKIPSWSALDPADRATLFARAKKLYALYHGAGCTNPFAFGMLGVAEGENEDLDPNGVGDFLDAAGKRLPWSEHPTGTPSSFGLHQRKEDRTIAIRDGRTSSETFRSGAVDAQGNAAHAAVEYAVLDRAGRVQLPRAVVDRLGMRDRVRMLGGETFVLSPAGGGLAVEARFGATEAAGGREKRAGAIAGGRGNIPESSG